MKFGHEFKEKLKTQGFPPDWVESAISYSQLKKCINRLTNELAGLGLDPQTLKKLLTKVEDYNAANTSNTDNDRPLEYLLSGEPVVNDQGGERKKPFHPKLIFYVSEETGELDSAHLDEETRMKLHMLAVNEGMTNVRVVDESEASQKEKAETVTDAEGIRRRPGYRTVEVHLTSDSEFFTRLAAELSGLEALQAKEEKRMHVEIQDLGKQIARMTDPDRKKNKKLLDAWRQIFQIYIESDIFFGTTEADHGSRNADKAAQRFLQFADKIAQLGLVDKLIRKEEATKALNTFMHINREILQGLQYGEINRTAMRKILKSKSINIDIRHHHIPKDILLLLILPLCFHQLITYPEFDKQTALSAQTSFPKQIEYPDFSSHLAKAVCAEVNTSILSNVPQIDDYSCPMCMELKWRPVRLRCNHVFCIRCLIVMQTNKQDHCPMCREKTVVDANSGKFQTLSPECIRRGGLSAGWSGEMGIDG